MDSRVEGLLVLFNFFVSTKVITFCYTNKKKITSESLLSFMYSTKPVYSTVFVKTHAFSRPNMIATGFCNDELAF